MKAARILPILLAAPLAMASVAHAQTVENQNIVAWKFIALPTAAQVASVDVSPQGLRQFGATLISPANLMFFLSSCVVQYAKAFGGAKPGYDVMWKCRTGSDWTTGYTAVVVPVGNQVMVSNFERVGFAPAMPPVRP